MRTEVLLWEGTARVSPGPWQSAQHLQWSPPGASLSRRVGVPGWECSGAHEPAVAAVIWEAGAQATYRSQIALVLFQRAFASHAPLGEWVINRALGLAAFSVLSSLARLGNSWFPVATS